MVARRRRPARRPGAASPSASTARPSRRVAALGDRWPGGGDVDDVGTGRLGAAHGHGHVRRRRHLLTEQLLAAWPDESPRLGSPRPALVAYAPSTSTVGQPVTLTGDRCRQARLRTPSGSVVLFQDGTYGTSARRCSIRAVLRRLSQPLARCRRHAHASAPVYGGNVSFGDEHAVQRRQRVRQYGHGGPSTVVMFCSGTGSTPSRRSWCSPSANRWRRGPAQNVSNYTIVLESGHAPAGAAWWAARSPWRGRSTPRRP